MNQNYTTDLHRGFGLAPAEHVTAVEQVLKSYPRVGIQPLPAGEPGRANADTVGIKDPNPGAALKFCIVGDSGGIKDPVPQVHTATAMTKRLVEEQDIAFAYHVGDEVYFNGDADQYAPQFYEPYAHFNRPIVGVPGNHDGAVSTDDSGNPTGRQPLDTFMVNFCDAKPNIPPGDPQFEYGRHTQTQPYCDWTLTLHEICIVGLYSNVPSGGHLEDSQIHWLVSELRNLPADVPLMVVLHHPPFSVDAHHGGSHHMNDALDNAFKAAARIPDMVVSGHVHDYQRFTRTIQYDNNKSKQVPYIVLGNSGYHNLHALAHDASPGMDVLGDGSLIFEGGDAHNWGFLVMTVADGEINGEYVAVDRQGNVTPRADVFGNQTGKSS